MRRKMYALLFFVFSIFVTAVFSGPQSMAADSERLAYVTSEGDNNLMIVDLNTEKILKILPTGKTPHALAFTKSGKCYVNNRGTKDLTIIDANKLEVIKTISLPATSFQLAISPDGRLLAVAYKDALKVSFIDTSADVITKTVVIGSGPHDAFKGAMMRHSYWSKDGKYLYASDDVNNTIVKIDPVTGNINATISLPGINHYIHPTKDGKLLYAANETTSTGTSITVIDAETDKIVKDIPIPLEAGEKGMGHHGEFSKDGRYFFFCNEVGRTVAVMDTAKMEIVKTIKAGMGAGHPGITEDGKYIFVIHHRDNVVAVIDTARQEVIKTIKAGNGKKQAHASYFSPDGKYFYMINAEDNVINKIDVAKMEVISTIPVGKTAMYFGIREGKEFPKTE
jgi:YVTN family beta-propeller protein